MKKFTKIAALVLAIAAVFTMAVSCKNSKANDAVKNVITVGYTIYDPMNYFDENGNLIGFDTDLAKAVFEDLGYKVLFTEINWDNKYTDLNSGAIDVIWNGFTANSADDDGVQRAEKVDFSYYYMGNAQVVVALKDSGITDAASLKDKIGYAEAGSAGMTYGKTFEENGAVMQEALKQLDALSNVNLKTADFAVLDEQLAKSYAGKGDYKDIVIIDALKSDAEYYAIGFKKGSELTAKVNAELEKFAADGTIAKLAEKYGVSNDVILDFSDQK